MPAPQGCEEPCTATLRGAVVLRGDTYPGTPCTKKSRAFSQAPREAQGEIGIPGAAGNTGRSNPV